MSFHFFCTLNVSNNITIRTATATLTKIILQNLENENRNWEFSKNNRGKINHSLYRSIYVIH